MKTNDRRTATHHGIDLETFEGFAAHAADDPEAVQFGLGASATYEGTAAHSPAMIDSYELGTETIARETREYTIPYGGWKEVLDAGGLVGATDRMEPIEVALSALVACINVGISIDAVANGADIESGEPVLDLDRGSRMDTFVAGSHVTETGTVTGIDMTDEQVEKSRTLAADNGFHNVESAKGTSRTFRSRTRPSTRGSRTA